MIALRVNRILLHLGDLLIIQATVSVQRLSALDVFLLDVLNVELIFNFIVFLIPGRVLKLVLLCQWVKGSRRYVCLSIRESNVLSSHELHVRGLRLDLF